MLGNSAFKGQYYLITCPVDRDDIVPLNTSWYWGIYNSALYSAPFITIISRYHNIERKILFSFPSVTLQINLRLCQALDLGCLFRRILAGHRSAAFCSTSTRYMFLSLDYLCCYDYHRDNFYTNCHILRNSLAKSRCFCTFSFDAACSTITLNTSSHAYLRPKHRQSMFYGCTPLNKLPM